MTGGDLLAATTELSRMAVLGEQTRQMGAYLDALLEEALGRARAGDATREAMADRVARPVHEGRLPRRHALGILVVLLGAGVESTASLIGNAVRLLAERPELQARLRSEPDLVSAFVEEAVRLEPPFRFHYRAVARDAELGGVPLRVGHRLMLSWASANRDEAVFENPDEIDLHRRFPRHHMSFGRGIHFCVGARLARLETRVVVQELLARTHRFEIDPARPPRYVRSLFVRRPEWLALRVA
jgi:cytochrome P450